MQKSEFILSFLIFTLFYTFTSSLSSVPVFADNHTNVSNSTHLACVNRACVPVNDTLGGNNTNLCAVSTDCFNQTNITVVRANRTAVVNLTHLECINQACVPVNGLGIDLCQTNAQCNITNLTKSICINQACVLVNITEINGTVIDCVTSFECQNITNSTGGGGGNGSNGSSGGGNDLPLAAPVNSAPTKQPTTLGGLIFSFIRGVTGFLGLDF